MRKLVFLGAGCLMLVNSAALADCLDVPLQARLVDEDHQYKEGARLPRGSEAFHVRNEQEMLLVKKAVIFTGGEIVDAQQEFDKATYTPIVDITLDSRGASAFKNATRDNIGKRIAIILFEQDKGEIITAPVIREEIGGGRIRISGSMSIAEAQNIVAAIKCQAQQRH